MASPPHLPPRLIEKKSDERDTFRLINAMRDQLAAGTIGGGSGQFSSNFSNNILGSNAGSEEIVAQVEVPNVLDSFQVLFGCLETSVGGDGAIILRFGGTDFATDGDVLMTLAAPLAASFTRVAFAAPSSYVNTSGFTKLKLGLASFAVSDYLKISSMAVTLV